MKREANELDNDIEIIETITHNKNRPMIKPTSRKKVETAVKPIPTKPVETVKPSTAEITDTNKPSPTKTVETIVSSSTDTVGTVEPEPSPMEVVESAELKPTETTETAAKTSPARIISIRPKPLESMLKLIVPESDPLRVSVSEQPTAGPSSSCPQPMVRLCNTSNGRWELILISGKQIDTNF